MATLKTSGFLYTYPLYATKLCLRSGTMAKACLNVPNPRRRNSSISLSNLSTKGLVEEELDLGGGLISGGIIEEHVISVDDNNITAGNSESIMMMEKLYVILEEVADRVEMHNNIKEQRDNWNSLFLNSINAITLAAATISGVNAAITSTNVVGAPAAILALKISSTLLYLAATWMLFVMNKIQPSQLAEEQRNAVRFFKRLGNEIQGIINLGTFTDRDVNEAMEKVLALDKAYPLPLLGVMLDKYPTAIEPAVWWPQQRPIRQAKDIGKNKDGNGWNGILEREMREIVEVMRRKDKAEYLRLGGKALKMNKCLAMSGPFLTGIAALGSAFVGTPCHGSWAVILGVVGGSLASVVNSFQHGGQVGMVVEMYRSSAGFFKLLEETIESNLMEGALEGRENGQLLEMKIALRLGRSLSELRNLASSSSSSSNPGHDIIDEFASKLF